MNQYSELINEAAVSAGFEPADSIRPGAGAFLADGLRVGWETNEKTAEAVFYVSIGTLPPSPSAQLCEFLLEQNCLGAGTAGGHIGLYAPTRVLLYSFRTPLGSLDARALGNMLTVFVSKAPGLIREMQSYSAAESTDITFDGSLLWV